MYIILDGNNLAHRTWHTPPIDSELVNDSVEDTLPLFLQSFCSVLTNVVSRVDRFRPRFTKLIICWDGINAVNKRRELYPPYKEHRVTERAKAAKTDRPSIPHQLINMVRDELGVVAPRYNICEADAEGDDLIALFCEIFEGSQICIVSRDQDMYQLVSHNVKILNVFTNELIGPSDVQSKFGVLPSGVVEMKALMGDASDNYPGLKGIGPKKALALYTAGGTETKYPEVDVFRKLAKIPFCGLDTTSILEKLVKADLDSTPNWGHVAEKFGMSPYMASRIQLVV